MINECCYKELDGSCCFGGGQCFCYDILFCDWYEPSEEIKENEK